MNQDDAGKLIRESFAAAVAAVDPRSCTHRAFTQRAITGSVGIVAVGKAAAQMSWGAHDAIGARLVAGVAVGPSPAAAPPGVAWHTGTHPIPDDRSEAAGRAVVSFLESSAVDALVFLVSGGGSALAEVPPDGLSIGELGAIHRRLLETSIPIEDVNLVRRSLSMLKNGHLLAHVSVPHLTLLMSDVSDSGPEVIASGPTMPTQVDVSTVKEILEQAGIDSRGHISRHLDSLVAQTPNDAWAVIADGWTAARAAAQTLAASGLPVSLPDRSFSGEARRVAPALIREAAAGFTVAPGEATVTVTGDGIGGRNTEAALTAAIHLDGEEDVVFAALTTDGVDGFSDAAGAIVDGRMAAKMRSASVSPEAALMDNDSHTALDAAGALVRTGPTGTNVADLWFVWKR